MVRYDEKRNYIRKPYDINVRLIKTDSEAWPSNREITQSKAINISGNGILLNTYEKLEIGAVMDVTFIKPNTFEFFKGPGKVMRIEEDADRSFNAGINFIGITPDDMRTLDYNIRKGRE